MPRKVLMVDDEPDFVEATKMLLEARGFEVIPAYDGEEGLRKAREERPDAIILDVMMPGMDGYQACAKLKADPELRTIPVLLLTAVGSRISETRYTKEMGMRTEAEDYIPKPVDPEELVRRVSALLE